MAFIKITDYRATDLPITYPPIHRLTGIKINKIKDQIFNILCTLEFFENFRD